jgi:UDP-N-acetyl-D-mannosaminuronate dehydrogenase
MKIAIVGLGYVGLTLAIKFASSNVNVIGLDVDKTKVDLIQWPKLHQTYRGEAIGGREDEEALRSDFSRVWKSRPLSFVPTLAETASRISRLFSRPAERSRRI